jgi:hypothetical protein
VRWADALVSVLIDEDADFGLPPLPPIATFVPNGALDAVAAQTGPVSVFGDSLALQAQGYLDAIAAAQDRELSVAAYGGTALCDWRAAAEETIAAGDAAEIVLAFVGNNVTACMDRAEGAALVARYVEDVEAIVALATEAQIPVTLVGPPDMGTEQTAVTAGLLRNAFSQVLGVNYVDASTALSPGGFAAVLPCLPFETDASGCVDGMIPVRDRDGIHLAPPNDTNYSSGAWRYAAVLLRAG